MCSAGTHRGAATVGELPVPTSFEFPSPLARYLLSQASDGCRRLADTWKKLGESYKDDSDVVIAHVDCTKAKSVCGKLEVSALPRVPPATLPMLPAPMREGLGAGLPLQGSSIKMKAGAKQAWSVCLMLQIRGYPTLQLFANGEKVDTYSGSCIMCSCRYFSMCSS